jgi:predicted amidohydrolase
MTDSGNESFGFVRVATAVPPVFAGRFSRNAERLIETATEASRQGVQVFLFPKMSLAGSSVGRNTHFDPNARVNPPTFRSLRTCGDINESLELALRFQRVRDQAGLLRAR